MSQVNIRVINSNGGNSFVVVTRPDGTCYETIMDSEVVRILAQDESADKNGYSFHVTAPTASN